MLLSRAVRYTVVVVDRHGTGMRECMHVTTGSRDRGLRGNNYFDLITKTILRSIYP